MIAYDYHQPAELSETIQLLQQFGHDAHLMAGGTSLVLMMKQGLIEPGHVIGLSSITSLSGIHRLADGGLELGAITTHSEIERSPEVRDYGAVLADAFSQVATIRIRNQATVGGSLAHADPAQDPPPILLALDAQVLLTGPRDDRMVPIDRFFTSYFETAIEPGEVLTAVRLPPLSPDTRAVYLKFLPRTEDDYATVSVAAAIRLNAERVCEDVRLGLGSVGTVPVRATGVEAALRGEELTHQIIEDAAAMVRDEVDPLDDARGSAEYKREMARVWAARALRTCLDEDKAARNGQGGQPR